MVKATFDLDENIAAALSYVLGWITGLVFFLFEERNQFVRFHAMQSILIFLPLNIIGWIFVGPLGYSVSYSSMYGVPYGVPTLSLFYYVGILIYVIVVVLWLILMFKALKGEKFKLPVVGDIAEKHA